MKTYRMTFSASELIVIKDSVHGVTLKGQDAPLVAGVLEKVYKGIEKAVEDAEAEKLNLEATS